MGLIGSIDKTPSQSASQVSQASPGSPSSSLPIQAGTSPASPSPSEQQGQESRNGRQGERKPEVADISGYWKDETGSIVHIIQDGDTFEFTVTNDFNGSSATGRGTIGTNNAEVEFVSRIIVAGQPVISEARGTLTSSHNISILVLS